MKIAKLHSRSDKKPSPYKYIFFNKDIKPIHKYSGITIYTTNYKLSIIHYTIFDNDNFFGITHEDTNT